MARITIEDCLKKIDSQYELVMLAKERTSQLNVGGPLLVPRDDDKNTVVALREIAEGKISIKTLEDHGIEKLRKNYENKSEDQEDLADMHEDEFDKTYKGEVSKSGTAILPSKRAKRMPEKIKLDSKINKEKDQDISENIEVENSQKKETEEAISEENKSE
jgi:DNA-directed RNA polymerase subunit omega